jgi:archaellum component FlaC
MKKSFILFLFAGLLSISSCTESFEPNVDYGDRTYINDYTALVSAVNDLNKNLTDRFDALNTLLKNGMTAIQLSIDANTGTIKIFSEEMKDNLSTINTTLFNGFSAISAQISTTGDKIVYAVNENGSLLRIQIDSTGKLISTQIKTTGEELAQVINSSTTTLADKIEALATINKAGFANIEAKIGKVGEDITLKLTDVNSSLGTINATMLNGFTTLATTINNNGNKIVTAIDREGDILKLAIDNNGAVISAKIESSATEIATTLKTAIESQTTTLDQKISALNASVQDGFTKLTVEVKGIGDKLVITNTALTKINDNINNVNTTLDDINTDMNTNSANLNSKIDALNTSIGTLDTDIKNSFTSLGTKLDENGTKIVTAINNEGDVLKLAINSNGEVISTALNDLEDSYNTAEEKNLAKMGEIIGAINELKTANSKNSKDLIDALEIFLTDSGIYLDNNNSQHIYMTPNKWNEIQEAGTESTIYKLYYDQIDELTITFTSKQVTDATGYTHDHATFTATGGDADPILFASGTQVVLINGTNRRVVEVSKSPVERHYKVYVSYSGCSHPYMFGIRLIDAIGNRTIDFATRYALGEPNAYPFVLKIYKDGVIRSDIKAAIYCVQTLSSPTYTMVDFDEIN